MRRNEFDLAEDFYIFLHNFMVKYPKFRGREIFITGESYAGHYIPVIARTLQLKQDAWINLAGLAIGNGWVDPFYQYLKYPDFAYDQQLITLGHKYVVKLGYGICQFFLVFHIPILTGLICNMVGITVVSPGLPAFNVYDVRLPCERMGLCYPDDHLWQIFNSFEYRDVMGIPK